MRKKTLAETPMKQFLTKKKDGWMVLQSSLPDRFIHPFNPRGIWKYARLQTELSQAPQGLCLFFGADTNLCCGGMCAPIN
jgi:hypothetical protein